MSPATLSRPARAPRQDAVLAAAVDLARAAAEQTSGLGDVGEHLGFTLVDDRLGNHTFATTAPGYRGWRWTVTVARVPRSRTATVCEVELLPGADALLAPSWVPWAERLAPGDLGPTDVLPFDSDDPRLETGYRRSGDAADAADAADVAVDHVAIVELGLERERVPTRAALDAAATRWYEGDRGPNAPGARASKEPCETCGFLVPLTGTLGSMFGVCVNEWSPDDGKVVSFDHGCGAHSETDAAPHVAGGDWGWGRPVVDEFDLEVLRAEPEPAQDAETEPAQDAEPEPAQEQAAVDPGDAPSV
ncbi:hypothetical protein Bcav_0849 [Beutenbergia cavernae DSM 12333]|uniref:DUF3027 domain-containing protein n=1 Tax=Beutenbergia cavernae (strain ATCC BAA-8 / DSM 12333 / CCUG 43141 / JCM 11478 / NBRC 16432 / NCIMB 13614 / HKI 0122) TaxID=471853 RepID=C5BZD8_BEUC1|nr:DUF3027 domain-containing protein [Beutenbergia cavernae]ACQ79110.1 hypothetical protein Bcav_0849 [Beutenbergia cavernae DSM 12333]